MCTVSLIENIHQSIMYGLPLHRTLYLTSLLPISRIVPRLRITIGLPLDLKLNIPLELLDSVWSNILHIFYCLDYEVSKDFRPKPRWTVIDVGAFVGLYTLRAAKLMNGMGLVISLEPSAKHYEILEYNLVLNGLDNIVSLRLGLAGSRGIRKLYITENSINSTLVRSYAEYMGCTGRIETIRVVRLKDLINMLRLKRIDLLKLDVEGAELEIVESSGDILKRGIVKRIVIEVHREVVSIRALSEILEEFGFSTIIYSSTEIPFQEFIYGVYS